MSSIRKWLASKVFSSVISTNNGNNGDNGTGASNGVGFGVNSRESSTSSDIGTSFFGSPNEFESSIYRLQQNSINFSIEQTIQEQEDQSYFSVIYHHHKSRIKKRKQYQQQQLNNTELLFFYLVQFFHANEDLNYISSELDTFDGRKDTDRCSALVNSLKIAQDRVISLIFKIMDQIGCERATREYRLKFPDELLTGEGVESLNSQIWFGAECLTGGSTITNNQDKSNYLRPIAKNLTTTLDQIRYELRACFHDFPKSQKIPKDLIKKLENFDKLFSSFEYDYVKAMLQIKSCEDIENLQELTYLFSETLTYALKKGLISKEDVDGCQPSVMIALPRLSIVRGLIQGPGSVVCKINRDDLTSILKPYHNLLLEFHEFLMNLNEDEIFFLEKLLSTNHDNIMDLSDNNDSSTTTLPPLLADNNNDTQDSLLTVFNKFFKHAKRMKDSGVVAGQMIRTQQQFQSRSSAHNNNNNKNQQQQSSSSSMTAVTRKSIANRYISASVDFLLTINNNNRNDDDTINNNNNNCNRYSPYKSPNEILFRFNSLPNLNFYTTIFKNENNGNNKNKNNDNLRSHNHSSISPNNDDNYSTSTTTTETSSSSSSSNSSNHPSDEEVSITCSSSSISVELDFLKQFKDILKRTQLKTLHKNRSGSAIAGSGSGGVNDTNTTSNIKRSDQQPRAKTAFNDLNVVDFLNEFKPSNSSSNHHHSIFTPTTSAFSNNSIHFDLDTFYTDDLSQLTIYTKKILHQVFVMISRIADEFQTNYASELRNILRTVFLLQQEDQEDQIDDSTTTKVSRPVLVDVQIGQFDDDENLSLENLEKIEQAIDAHEYLQTSREDNLNLSSSFHENLPSTSNSSLPQQQQQQQAEHETNNDSCDIANHNHHNHDNGFPSSSMRGSTTSLIQRNSNNSNRIHNNNNRTSSSSLVIDSSRNNNNINNNSRQKQQFKQSNQSINSSNSSLSSRSSNNSYRSLQHSQITSSSATTIDESAINRGEIPPFIFHHHQATSSNMILTNGTNGINSNSSPSLTSPIIPILSIVPSTSSTTGPSSSSATNLLLPPIWIPDDLVTNCKLCNQTFNLIRRRHHCRRCGQIFCNQCSNNFVSLKCFGYAKPVRVCNTCLKLHKQSEQQQKMMDEQQPQIPDINFGASSSSLSS